ncbi:ABC transporter [Mycolicibacterium sp. GF69]|nr:ABC transporter [Mycolicibacterium sp. GF69]
MTKGSQRTLAISTTLHTSFDEADERSRKALSDQGFGVLTEIDVKATLKAKLGEDMEDYLILGTCNPPLAHRAIGVDRQIGLLLPCNVVVRTDPSTDGVVIVDAMDPQLMLQVVDRPGLAQVADEAAAMVHAAIEALAQ